MSSYFLWSVATCVAVTFALRVTPFIVKTRLYGSALLENLGRWMPMGAMLILLVYCLDGVSWSDRNTSIAYGVGLIVTVAMHLWRRNAVLSIVVGTVFCVGLLTTLG